MAEPADNDPMTSAAEPVPQTRVDEVLDFDASTGRLRLGDLDETLPGGSDNRQVLVAYVGLVERRRGRRPQSMVEVRTDDVDTLSILLELDSDDLEGLLQELLGTTPAQATRLVARLRARRSVLGLAAAAAGVVLVGGIAIGVAGTHSDRNGGSPATIDSPITGHDTATTAPVPQSGPPASAPPSAAVLPPTKPHPSVSHPAPGVGLIDPIQVDAPGTGLAPAADQNSGSTTTTTTTTPAPGH